MPLKTPVWWYKREAKGAPVYRYVALPLAGLWWLAGTYKRLTAKPFRSIKRVISVGNVTLGGSGKTPLERELLRRLTKRDFKPALLTRGYGGSLEGPVRVEPAHTAAEVGDEAVMIAADYPVYVARDRAEGLRFLESAEPDIIVTDDTHQNVSIHKDVHILVVDGDTSDDSWPFGDELLFPCGPMREPLSDGLARADIVVLWLPDEGAIADPRLMKRLSSKTVYVARLVPVPRSVPSKVIGFAAIAKPWKFKNTLTGLGYNLLDFLDFPDHQALDEDTLNRLWVKAQAKGIGLITTEKDWVKLSPQWREKIDYLPITARFDDQAGFMRTLLKE
ncbi:MAG: tetraacyldisaccharide 4'-kinase [Asticcacaulis sp.]